MITTETDAKTRWCPMARWVRPDGGSYDSGWNNDKCGPAGNNRCQGSGCMAWRWAGPTNQTFVRNWDDPKAVTEPPTPECLEGWTWMPYDEQEEQLHAGWLQPIERAQAKRVGFCGLARRPRHG